ncbi:MAG: LytR C-terminal domain-containing protein [Candidatus Cloacimonetes bacterium]|nr:LytR C-terminal domain-containing protein [Candidatus Cloacimonadota bacterium]
MDLTNNEPQEKLTPKWKLWVPVLLGAIALLAVLGWFFFIRPNSSAPSEYGEDKLPAIKVTISNGCGYEQLASEFAASLTDKNIEVVGLGDTPKPIYDKSIIVIRKGDEQDLKRLQTMTGIQRWTSAYNEYYNADFEIIVGRDYEEFMTK